MESEKYIELNNALDTLKESIIEIIDSRKSYVPISNDVLYKEDKVTNKYIVKRFNSIIESCPYKVEFVTFNDSSKDGSSLNRTILIKEDNPRKTQFETLLHEWTHIILHQRLNAVEKDLFTKELEAESVSFIVGYVLGHIDEMSHSYIYSYLSDITFDKSEQIILINKVYKSSEKRIIKTATKILGKLALMQSQIKYHTRSDGEKL